MLIIPAHKANALEAACSKLELTMQKRKRNVVKKDVADAAVKPNVVEDKIEFTQEEFHDLDVAIMTLQDLIREYRQPVLRNLVAIKEDLYEKLDSIKNPYAWATTTYSAENLEQFDELTRNHLKLILREYFDAKGNYYEGWKK